MGNARVTVVANMDFKIHSRLSGVGEEQPRYEPTISTWRIPVLLWWPLWASVRSREEQEQQTLMTLPSSIPNEDVLPSSVSNLDTGQEQQTTETHAPGAEEQDESSPDSIIYLDEDEEATITSVRATDVAKGLRRLPAGFSVTVHHSNLEWRTESKPSFVNNDIIQWGGPIPIPSGLSTTIRLEVYASFEFQPMLGTGEQLRQLVITVRELLDHSTKDIPFVFSPKAGDTVSPCSSISVTVERRRSRSNNSATSSVLAPRGSPPRPRSLLEDATDRGHNALLRYRELEEKRDLMYAIKEFERALSICPPDHPCRAVAQSNLAMAKSVLCQIEDTDASFPLSLYLDVLRARPLGHADRPSTLIHLASVHFAQFERLRDGVCATRAKALLQEAVELSHAESHENRTARLILQSYAQRSIGFDQPSGQSLVEQDSTFRLTDEDLETLSVGLLHRFERFGDIGDLQQAITLLTEMVRSTAAWDGRYCRRRGNLGVALLNRFRHLGELSDLEGSISLLVVATNLTPRGHPDKPAYLTNLGNSLNGRFERLGELSDLEDAITNHKDAVDLTPRGHVDKPDYLSNLGNAFFRRFEHLGELADLERAVSSQSDAVRLATRSHPDKFCYLNNLGVSLKVRFQRLGKLTDIEDAISMLREAINLIPHDHPFKPNFLNNLGFSFFCRFERLGELGDLEDAISKTLDAIGLTPHGHTNAPARLNNLGTFLRTRFERLGVIGDLEDAISRLRDAVDLTPPGHTDMPDYLDNLAITLATRFQRLGELSDLEGAISSQKDAVDLTLHGHPHKPGCLDNLGSFFRARFRRLGELSDLEHAISRQRYAIRLVPHDQPGRDRYLASLGNSLITRFQRLHELSDLEDATSILRDAVTLTPHDHPDKSMHLANLGISLKTRFEFLDELRDLEDGILAFRDAVALTPHGQPSIPDHLGNLANCLIARFERFGELADLEDAISMLRDAVELTPHGHPHRSSHLNDFGSSLLTRFIHSGKLDDLEEAISRQKNAVELTPHGHPEKSRYFSHLADSVFIRFERLGELGDLDNAISLYFHAACSPFGTIHLRFRASRKWISCARRVRHRSLLYAYSVAIDLLPRLAWIGLSLTHRYSTLVRGVDVVREAAAAALDAGFPETAVEWLERGRSIVWGELLHLRGSYDELSSKYPDHARRLRELSIALDHASATREKHLSVLSEQTTNGVHHVPESLQEEASRHRAFAIERDKLLQDIRRLPGFERFLLQKDFSQLRASAHTGPVVMLNAAEERCDALIILANMDRVIHVPLPAVTLERSVNLQNALKGFIRGAREGKSVVWNGANWESFLSTLWKCVVKPVLHALAFSTSGDLSRIFWCPTGPFAFLPIHAAGLYEEQYSNPGHKVFDFVISSYVPSLAVLASSPSHAVVSNSNLQFLAVPQPPSDGQSRLPGVVTELQHIRDIIGTSRSASTTLTESSVGTVEEVLSLMKEADMVHFACHGIQDGLDSGLCLADQRRLKVRDIIALSRPRGGLAFLSACQTAMGEELLSDEAIHIAAGMLFAGYGGVIGTMWSISDVLAPEVTRKVYEHLFRNGARPDCREAARALHGAIGDVRESEKVSFDEWVPFVHVGL